MVKMEKMAESKTILILILLVITGGCYFFKSKEEKISSEWKGKKVEELYIAWGNPDKEISYGKDKVVIYEKKEVGRTPGYWSKSPSETIYRDGRRTTMEGAEVFTPSTPYQVIHIFSFWVDQNGKIFNVEVSEK